MVLSDFIIAKLSADIVQTINKYTNILISNIISSKNKLLTKMIYSNKNINKMKNSLLEFVGRC